MISVLHINRSSLMLHVSLAEVILNLQFSYKKGILYETNNKYILILVSIL